MQNTPLQKICAIRAYKNVNGFPLCLTFLNKLLRTDSKVFALLFLHLKRELPQFLKDRKSFTAIQCLDVKTLDEIRLLLSEQNIPKDSLIFIDALHLLIDQFSLPSTSWFLSQLSELYTSVLFLAHGIAENDWKGIESIAATVFELQERNGVPVCKTIIRKKNGSSEVKVEQFVIRDDYSVECTPYVEPNPTETLVEEALKSQEEPKTSNFDTLPFDVGLRLNENERRAKASVQLPYIAAQTEKGLVGLNISSGKRIKVGGQIVYTPDKEDDFDDSDPDDDLTI